ncbi:hypothetical protein GCM10007938_42250 [Vibrio zhanjiangensis]|uniref:Uncharacterized protein n=1 Tax=Vibrio zhanjiangensis TaxID=1046128 RepID=A0ABQ6F4H4_9VIBR|nr:hypothetical protein GCM10007938_42250 [Vibrio zhanjiangensis]
MSEVIWIVGISLFFRFIFITMTDKEMCKLKDVVYCANYGICLNVIIYVLPATFVASFFWIDTM